MRKIWIVILIVLVCLIALWFSVRHRKGIGATVKIGAVLVLTGPDAKAGQSARQGIQMAADEINKEGGVRGRKVKIIYEDDQGEPEKAVSAVLKLINVDKVPAIIGPMWSTSVLAVAPIAEKNKVVILSPTASAPKITTAGDFIFRNTYSDTYEGAKDAEFAYKVLRYRRAGIVHVNLDAGVQIADVFSRKFRELGGQVIIREAYEPKTKDFRTLLTKFKGKPIDFIYLMGYSEMGQLVKQAREIGLKVPFLSTIMFEISDVLKVAGSTAEGTVYSFPSYDPGRGGKIVKEFARAFKARYGVLPDPEAAFSYDALKILCYVMEKVGFNSIDIKEGLYKVKDYQGVTGKTSFDKNGDVVKPIGFKKIVGGKYVWLVYKY